MEVGLPVARQVEDVLPAGVVVDPVVAARRLGAAAVPGHPCLREVEPVQGVVLVLIFHLRDHL